MQIQFWLYAWGTFLASSFAIIWESNIDQSQSNLNALPGSSGYFSNAALPSFAVVILTAGCGLVIASMLHRQDNLVKIVGNSACLLTVFIWQALLLQNLHTDCPEPLAILSVGIIAIATWAYHFYKVPPTSKYMLLASGDSLITSGHATDVNSLSDYLDDAESSYDSEGNFSHLQNVARHWFQPSLQNICLALLSVLILTAIDWAWIQRQSTAASESFPNMDLPLPIYSAESVDLPIKKELRYENRHTGSFAAFRQRQMEVCRFRNVCMADRTSWKTGNNFYFWLIGSATDVQAGSANASAIFQDCAMHGSVKEVAFDFLERAPPTAQWYNGTTYAFAKFEPGNHPGSWGRAWASYVSSVAWEWDFLGDAGNFPGMTSDGKISQILVRLPPPPPGGNLVKRQPAH